MDSDRCLPSEPSLEDLEFKLGSETETLVGPHSTFEADALDVLKTRLLNQIEEKVTPLNAEAIEETALIETEPMGLLGHEENREMGEEHVEKIGYSRLELEALRFAHPVGQEKLWKRVYDGLGDLVAREYDDMDNSKQQQQQQQQQPKKNRKKKKKSDHRDRCSNMDEGESLVISVNNGTHDGGLLDLVCSYDVNNGDGHPFPEKECSADDDDSEEDYGSIQRPAFWVEGEPNFESGSPEDGFEYLRRVRWEAARIPKVRVAKVDKSKFNTEQSDYMPKIPEIAKCPEQLLPLKQWEDAFLSEFSELRLGLSLFEGSHTNASEGPSSEVIFHRNGSSPLPPVNIVYESFAHVESMEVDCTEKFDQQPSLLTTEGGSAASPVENFSRKAFMDHSYSPLLSVIFKLDSVARVSMLRKRIKAAQDTSTLSRDDCLWLFALCAVVDTPLDADTSASLRSLLRKCAALRATKSILDDELIMLNILATIAGRYFGQSES